jgi:GxxExxY protein
VRELKLRGRDVSSQREFRVAYKGEEVGTYYTDFVVEEKVIVEVKSAQKIDSVHRAQLLNYLKISGLRVGLIMNFSKPKLQFERLVL